MICILHADRFARCRDSERVFLPGTENVFYVTAISSTGERSSSVTASIDTGSATPPFNSAALAAPTGLRSSRYSSQAFELFWNRVEGQAYQYEVTIMELPQLLQTRLRRE